MKTALHRFFIRLCAGLLLCTASAAALAETYYYFVGYRAQPKPREYLYVFEKQAVAIPNADNGTAADELRADYVAFIKNRHPDYYEAYVIGTTDPKMREFNIRAPAEIQGHFMKAQDALKAREARMDDLRKRIAADPSTGRLVESDEYKYKKWGQ